MNYIVTDYTDALRNRETVILSRGKACYNAVLERPKFSDEGAEPITLQEAKDWLRIDVTDDDSILTRLIKGARQICETYVNLSLITRKVTARIRNGLGNFYLPYGPADTDTIVIKNTEGTAITGYVLNDPYSEEITVEYNAGYATLPEDLRTAIFTQIAWMYTQRGDAAIANGLCLESQLILNPYRND